VTDSTRGLEFVYTPLFDAATSGLFDDDAMRQIELSLLVEPRAGVVVAGTGGIRKLRARSPGRGKRGGARILYLYVEIHGCIYFLLAYAKNEQVDLAPAQKRSLRAMVKQLEELG
jgi:hypothetical protein